MANLSMRPREGQAGCQVGAWVTRNVACRSTGLRPVLCWPYVLPPLRFAEGDGSLATDLIEHIFLSTRLFTRHLRGWKYVYHRQYLALICRQTKDSRPQPLKVRQFYAPRMDETAGSKHTWTQRTALMHMTENLPDPREERNLQANDQLMPTLLVKYVNYFCL
jgi:hypothetical protein